ARQNYLRRGGSMAFPSFGPPSFGEADAFREEIIVQAPPSMPRVGAGAGTQLLPYLLFPLLGAGSMAPLFFRRGGAGPLTWLLGGASALGMVVMLVFTLVRSGSQKKVQINDERRDYLRYLLGLRKQVQRVADRQTEETLEKWPAPEDLWLLPDTRLLWRARPGHPALRTRRGATTARQPVAGAGDRAAGGPGSGLRHVVAPLRARLRDRTRPAGHGLAALLLPGGGQRGTGRGARPRPRRRGAAGHLPLAGR